MGKSPPPLCACLQGSISSTASVDTHDTAPPQNINTSVPKPRDATFDSGYVAAHPGMKQAPAGITVQQTADPDVRAAMKNPVYPKEYLESVHYKHLTPEKVDTSTPQQRTAACLAVAMHADTGHYLEQICAENSPACHQSFAGFRHDLLMCYCCCFFGHAVAPEVGVQGHPSHPWHL